MQSHLNIRQQITFWSCMLILPSLLFSKFLLTIGMIVLITNAVLNKDAKIYFKFFIQDKLAMAFTAIFLLYLVSYFQSENIHYWAERLRVKLPFLILPFAIANLFPLPKKYFQVLLATFFLIVFGSSVFSFTHYLIHFQSINESYNYAKTLWTPIDHVRFSLAVVIALWLGIYLYRTEFYFFNKNEKFAYFSGSILLLFYLHLLAVRSGLVALYLSTAYFFFYFLLIKKKWKHAVVLMLSFIVMLTIAFEISPTLSTKIRYMRYDLAAYLSGKNITGTSDGGRLMSQKMSWEVIKNNAAFGVGMGDVEDKVKQEYALLHPEIADYSRLEPHSQFLFVAVGMGTIGLLLFLIPILYSFFSVHNYKKWLIGCVFVSLFSSFFTEATLEIQIGTALFLFFILLLHYQFKSEVEI